MRILITGAEGFAGRHLIEHLTTLDAGDDLHGTIFRAADSPHPDVTYHRADLRDQDAVDTLIKDVQPEQIYHLAAQANVGQSYSAVWSTLENNIRGQLNLILACVKHNLKPRLLVVSSGDIYGDHAFDAPATETALLCPSNPYSVSKVTQDMLALQYHLSNNLPTLRARPFNHLGPGQSGGFVAPDFAMQIARIEAGQQEPVMRVGSLAAERDFTDVRDVVRAYALIMAQGTPGDAYNIASGRTVSVQQLLDILLSYSRVEIRAETDAARLRPHAASKSWGDASRLHALTGWQPTIPLEMTLRDVLDDCRLRVQAQV